ncbi:hypothetical protein GGR57DRAFT_240786 [Xylariaceae sp. FL1272]|nr:hypothetical protein GGR57DRAFT_240786 [Xylariaceae sp. FL1272]
MATEESLRDTAEAFISAFATLDPKVEIRAANCTHNFAPSSLGMPTGITNEAWEAHLKRLRQVMSGFPVTAKEIHINVAKRQVVIWATAVPNFRDEAKDPGAGGDVEGSAWTGEYVFLLDMNEEGKIDRIVEFLDSLATSNARTLLSKAFANVGATGKSFP